MMMIQVSQLSCDDVDLLAPPGCLTYNTQPFGSIMSFNLANGTGEMINNQRFSHCIKHQEGYCDVSLTSSEFDIGQNKDTGDSLTIGSTLWTGSNFGTDGQLLCKKREF